MPALPAELTVHAVEALRDAWLPALDAAGAAGGVVALDASAVAEVDAAGLQWLASLRRALADRGVVLRVAPASDALREAGRVLGLSVAGGLDDDGGAR